MTGCRCSMASPAWTIRTSWHRAPRSTRPAAGHRDSRDMSVMAEIGWQGLFTVAVIVVTLAMLLWERFSPDRGLVAAPGAFLPPNGFDAPPRTGTEPRGSFSRGPARPG